MLRFLKIFCISAVCLIEISGCSPNQEKVEKVESQQLEQTEADDKKESENTKEERLDLSNVFNEINGCAVLYSPTENQYSLYNKDMAK